MNSNSREIRRWNIKSFSNRRCIWRCYRCCCFLLFGQLVSACTFHHLFVRLLSLCLRFCWLCTRLSNSLPFIQLLLFVQDTSIRLLFKLPLKFRKVSEHKESRSSFACNQNIKEDISTAFEFLVCFETK